MREDNCWLYALNYPSLIFVHLSVIQKHVVTEKYKRMIQILSTSRTQSGSVFLQ